MTDAEKFRAYVSIPYFEQAKAFLNVYWSETEKDAENVWNYAHKFVELDLDKKEEGRDLDEFNAHRFLESFKETKTVKQMREEIRRADLDFNKRLALVEFLLWKYNKNVKDFVKVPIGSDEEVTKAENKLKEVQAAFAEANARAAEAKQAYQAAKASEAAAKQAEAEAKAQEAAAKAREAEAKAAAEAASQKEAEAKNKEAELRAAQEELEAALAELKAQEDAYNKRTEDLKQASETGGMVSRNKAKNELAQHLGTDPLPLRKAKITQEAAVKKAERATEVAKAARAVAEAAANEARNSANAASQARAQAEQARRQAEQAAAQAEADRIKAEKAKQAAEAALEAAREKVEEAEAYLQEVKARLPKGTAWWIDRSIAEQKKYLPQRKQK